MIQKPLSPRSSKRFAARFTATLLVAVVAACAPLMHGPFPPWQLEGPQSSAQCEKMPLQGHCPRCAHCTWTESTKTCIVDDFAPGGTCQCYEGQSTTCDGGVQTCHIIDKTHSTACL